MLRIPEIVVRPVETPQDLLPGLRGEFPDPVQPMTGRGEALGLFNGTQTVPTLLPQVHALFQGHVPKSARGVTPPGQDAVLILGGVRAIFAPHVRLHPFTVATGDTCPHTNRDFQ